MMLMDDLLSGRGHGLGCELPPDVGGKRLV